MKIALTIRLHLAFYVGFGITASLLGSRPTTAQVVPVLAPHKPVTPRATQQFPLPPPVPGSLRGGPWFIDNNYKSSVYIRNGVETSSITVSPVLYLSNGNQYTLPDISIKAAGNATLDIGSALDTLGIASYATLSGYIELKYEWPWDPICATIRNLDTTHSTIYNYGLRSSKPLALAPSATPTSDSVQVFDGLWWKQESKVTGFLALSNTTSSTRNVDIDLSDDTGASFTHYSVSISTHATKMIHLDELSKVKSDAGGVHIAYTGTATDLLINGGLEDLASGYSATMPFTAAPASQAQSTATVAELGLMTGPADPMMHFPAGISFSPFTALRNISTSVVVATPTFWWMNGGRARSFTLTPITLSPSHSQTLDFPTLLTKAGLKDFSGNLELVFQVAGDTAGLLLAGGSVDLTNTYVFEDTPHGVSESGSKSMSYWSIGNGDDTMVTLWNPADEAQDFTFKLTYGGGHYILPIRLEPRAARDFNISQLAGSGLPDPDGNFIPADVLEGGATITGSRADNQQILVAMDSGVYNVRKATCGSFCQTCNGVTGAAVALNPFTVPVSQQTQLTLYETWNTGSQYNDTSASGWSTSNSSVATVGTHGNGTAGLVAGVSSGSPTISASYPYTEAAYTNYWCEGSSWSCPYQYVAVGGSSPGTVLYPDHSVYQGTSYNGAAPNSHLSCQAGYTGWDRAIDVLIATSGGQALTASGVVLNETVTLPQPNAFGVTQVKTGTTKTQANGVYPDEFYVCSTACPGSATATATQSLTYGSQSVTHTNSIVYTCGSVKFDGN